MNAKISVFVICVEAVICLLLHKLHDCTFKTLKKVLLGFLTPNQHDINKQRRCWMNWKS